VEVKIVEYSLIVLVIVAGAVTNGLMLAWME
jgi:hypothetical protein